MSMDFFGKAFDSVKHRVSHVTDAVRQLFHSGPGADDHHEIQGSTANNVNDVPNDYDSVPTITVLPFTHDPHVLAQPASAYTYPYGRTFHPLLDGIGLGSTQSLPPPYTPREDLPVYSRSVNGQEPSSYATQTWRRISARFAGARLFVGPLGRPSFQALSVSFRSLSATASRTSPTGPTLPRHLNTTPRRPGRLDWLPKPVKYILIAVPVVGLGVVVLLVMRQWLNTRSKSHSH